MRFSVECAFPHLRKRGATSRKGAFCADGLTENRTLQQPPHGKPHSATVTSRKTALCNRHLTENRTLHPPSYVKAQSAPGDSRKDALWGLTLTQKRTLRRRRHRDVTEGRTLDGRRHGEAHFACGPHQKAHSVCDRSRRMHFAVRVRVQSALFREGPRAECAFP